MIKLGIKRGFTLVELLIVVAIITMLSGAAYIGIQRSQSRGMNQRMTDDLSAIVNALEQYKEDDVNHSYPLPALGADKNVLCFKEDLSYAHGGVTDCASALFMQAQIDNTLLTKRYLQEVPTDPRTSSRYAYGVTADGKYYEVAGNFEESDGTWTARTAGNVTKYPFLTSLIRAYNGPDFVVDGEGWLPYSPDHLSITATLTDITGTVEVDGTAVTPASSDELRTVKPGSTITTTGPASSAILYFSDGSITYLDPDTTLRVLPSTAVEKNDKDGIITKIRLKLSFGKIWNKVARLASKSEFNVETTGAIAGVRGTEFGIDAVTNELIVLSGTVVARRKTSAEMALSGGDQYLEFDNGSTYFSTTQVASSGGTTFNQFTLPSDPGLPIPAGMTLSSSQENKLRQKYYAPATGLSGADTPYIVKAVSKTDGTYTIYVAFNGFEENTAKVFKGFEIYGQSQVVGMSAPRALKDEALGHPLLIVENFTYSPADKAYTFDIDSKKSPGNPLNKTGEMELITLRAFQHTYGKTVYSRLSWPLIGFVPDEYTAFTYEYDNSQVYQEFFGQLPPQPPTGCTGTLDSIVVAGGSPIMVAGSSAQFNATASYSNPPCTQPVTSQCSWTTNPPSGGTISPTGNLHVATAHSGPLGIICTLPPKTGQYASSVLKQLQSVCYGPDLALGGGDDEGYWDIINNDDSCWVLADAGKNCDDACPSVGGICEDASNPGGTNWDDDNPVNDICMKLANAIQPPLNPTPQPFGNGGTNAFFSPYFRPVLNRCYARHDSITNFAPFDLCSTTQNMSGQQRVCRCI